MSMFDWSAKEGNAVISERFWIYWATAGPLTILVIGVWYFWLRGDIEHEKENFDSAQKTLDQHPLNPPKQVSTSSGSPDVLDRLRRRFGKRDASDDIEAIVEDATPVSERKDS
jgi:hypothetical protein